MKLDHERQDGCPASLDFAVFAFWRHSRDQLLRASQSTTLNIAEGRGKWRARIGQSSDQVREREAVYESVSESESGHEDTETPNKPLHLTAASGGR
ncbi:MAG: hypothetical protein AB7O52_06035 [Planctomycetota bacterium]